MVSWRGPSEFDGRDQRSSGDDRSEQWQHVCGGAVLRGAWHTAEVIISIGGQWPSDVRALQFFVASRMSANTSETSTCPATANLDQGERHFDSRHNGCP
jgi:hypothetical protein